MLLWQKPTYLTPVGTSSSPHRHWGGQRDVITSPGDAGARGTLLWAADTESLNSEQDARVISGKC